MRDLNLELDDERESYRQMEKGKDEIISAVKQQLVQVASPFDASALITSNSQHSERKRMRSELST